jgi:hypothetical protein
VLDQHVVEVLLRHYGVRAVLWVVEQSKQLRTTELDKSFVVNV